MAEINKTRTRMYDPWGYQEENNYESSENQFELELNELIASAAYNKDDKKIHFFNNDGLDLSGSSIDTSEFASGVIESATYDKETKILTIVFSNGDIVEVNLADLIDENEFADGLQVNDGIVSIKLDSSTEAYLTVGPDGLKLSGVDAAINVEKTRAEEAETALQAAIEAEGQRAQEAEEALDTKIDEEIARATSAETALDTKITQEIVDREADVDAEEARAKAVEEALDAKLDQEIQDRKDDVDAEETRAKAAETVLSQQITSLNSELDAEESIREAADVALGLRIDNEIADRKADVDAEEARAIEVENTIKAEAFFDADYDSSAKTINFYNKQGEVVDSMDATPFLKDGMIDSVYIDHETEELVIVWNTAAGKEETRIPLKEIFNPEDYYTKVEVDAFLAKKVDKELNGANGKALIFNESDGGGAKFEHNDGTWSFAGVNDGGENGIAGQIYALKKNAENKFEGARIDVTKNGMYYTVGADSAANRLTEENEIATKGDVAGTETELFRLEQLLGHKDNDTLVVQNDKEAAFGKYNVSNTSEDASGRTIFSIGNGTADDARSNALEIRENGDIYMWIEGDFIQVNDLIGMLAHEVYDTNANNNHNMNYDG